MNEKLRRIENLHILLWLVKDLCWVTEWKAVGTVMFFPTFFVALWLTWRSRQNYTELMHNIAVTLWILANGNWMMSEFFWEEKTKMFSAVLFGAGLLVLAIYYLPLWFSKKVENPKN